MTKIAHINANQLKDIFKKDSVMVVDVREKSEFLRERITGAINAPLSDFNPDEVSRACGGAEEVVVHCLSGMRTQANEEKFKLIKASKVMILEGGITAWKKSGGEVVKDCTAPIALGRQLQIVAGFLVLVGVILGFTVSQYFFLLSGFVGLGLFFGGLSGFCMMEQLLGKLPYNRPSECNKGCK